MKNIALACLLAGTLAACSSESGKQASATETTDSTAAAAVDTVAAPVATEPTLKKRFDSFLDGYWDHNNQLYPLDATTQGDDQYNGQLVNDGTRAFRDSLQSFYETTLTDLQQYDRAQLAANDRISYDMLRYDLQTRLEGLKLGIVPVAGGYLAHWTMPFNQFGGLPLTVGQYGAGEGIQPFKTVKDYDNWLQRAGHFSVWADTAISNFRQGMKAGMVLPKALVVKMVPQMQALVVADPTQSLFYGPINKLPKSFSAADKKRLTAAYKELISKKLVPAYKKLGDFLQNEYLPKARTSTGISAVPNGDALYRYFVKAWTTTNKSPDEIYKTGNQEVERIRGEMERIKTETGFKGDLPAFFAYLRTDKKFMPYKTAEEILTATRDIQKRIDPNLQKMFGRTPKTPFEVRQTEAFRAASASAEYNQGSPDGSRPGIYYIPIVDPTQFNITSGMESTFLHEALPGHHYQISLQQENDLLPRFRRFAWYGAMGEGWALYAESLGKELGLYTDPYQHMGALGDEMHRAVRLVVDVAMHQGRMSREQAIQYMMANEPVSEDGAVAEIERYMAIPGQALSYKTGALKIRELREKYASDLGSKFNISNFHDELLQDGVMPLAVLETKMNAWAARQK